MKKLHPVDGSSYQTEGSVNRLEEYTHIIMVRGSERIVWILLDTSHIILKGRDPREGQKY